MSGKTVAIGIDGVPPEVMEGLVGEGVMENFGRLMEEGKFSRMESSLPAVSSASWSSIITGKNPGEHGVYGFSDMIEGTYSLRFNNFRSLKSKAFWERNNKRNVIMNVPSTYPAEETNGVHISGFVSPDFEKAVYPETLKEKLKEMNYRVDVDSEKGHKSKRLLFKELFDVLDARIEAYRHLWDREDWDTFKLVFTGSDRLEHFLWDAWEDEGHEHREKFLEYFRRVDEVIGEVDSKMDEDDSLIILSDHGMEGVKKNVNLNGWLVEEGLLNLREEGKRYNRVGKGSKAFALEHGRIYLNREGKYPRGSVSEDEEEDILNEIKGKLMDLERNGEKVVKEVHRGEDIYKGEEVGKAPDLVVVPKSGYRLRGKMEEKVFEDDSFQGMHNRDAFMYAKGPVKEHMPDKPHVEDFVPMINKIKKEATI
ncbi:MAG: alkaline phosphatase family protein [Candidatus Aenigmatarchaeota archaeon]